MISAHPENVVTVLSVTAALNDQESLRDLFRHTKWVLREAGGCQQALTLLRSEAVPVVLCESSLPDGDWREMIQATAGLLDPPLVIVVSRLADDRLWSEVLNLGGYDVLERPFDSSEMYRVVSLAWLHWKNRRGAVRVVNG